MECLNGNQRLAVFFLFKVALMVLTVCSEKPDRFIRECVIKFVRFLTPRSSLIFAIHAVGFEMTMRFVLEWRTGCFIDLTN